MVSGVAFDGLASGLETQEILDKLMEIEREPINRLVGQREQREAQKEAWEDINTSLSSLDSILSPLRDNSTFASRSVTSSNESAVTARADTYAVQGYYEIEIQNLARAHRVASARMHSATDELSLDATLQLNGQQVEIEPDDSLSDIRSSINEADAGVRASIVDNHLVINAEDTGAGSFIDLVQVQGSIDALALMQETSASAGAAEGEQSLGALDAGADGVDYDVVALDEKVVLQGQAYRFALRDDQGRFVAVSTDAASYEVLEEKVEDLTAGSLAGEESFDFSHAVRSGTVTAVYTDGTIELTGDAFSDELASPRDAEFTIDGLQITAETNTGIDGVMEGVTFDLNDVTEGPETLEIAHDTDRALSEVRAFVDKYNEVMDRMNTLGSRDEVLAGDTTLRRITSSVREMVMREAGFSEDHELNYLHEVGISIDRYGEMSLDEGEFTEALRENPADVRVLFAGRESQQGADGLSRRLGSHLHTYLRSGDGILTQREQMYDRMIDSIDDRMESLERRLARREDNLTRQFSQMEQMLSDLHSQGQWLSGQINSLPGMQRDA